MQKNDDAIGKKKLKTKENGEALKGTQRCLKEPKETQRNPKEKKPKEP